MDIKDLVEANEAITMLEELKLPISIEQLGKRKMLETEYLKEHVIPQIQVQVQSLVEHLHKSFCLVVEYDYGYPVEVRIAEQTKIKADVTYHLQNEKATQSRIVSNAYKSDRIQRVWQEFLDSLPKGNPYYKFTISQSYSSLSKLLRVIQSKDMIKYTSSLFEALKLPTTGKMTPTAFKNMLEPEQFVQEKTKDGIRRKVFKVDGITPVMVDKAKKIKEGKWSLKLLCDLMAQKEYLANLHPAKHRQ